VEQRIRLAEVLGSLSLATDLATGQPMEHGLRRSLLAVWLGELMGVSAEDQREAYFASLLGAVGCTLEGAEYARYFKDELQFQREMVSVDPNRPLEVAAFLLRKIGEEDSPLRRAAKFVSLVREGPDMHAVVCRDIALRVGDMMAIGPSVQQAIAHCHEQWDGKGAPLHLKGEEIRLAARIFAVVNDADIFYHVGGLDAAMLAVRSRAGRQIDPHIAQRFLSVAPRLFSRLTSTAIWDATLSAEPAPPCWLSCEAFDALAQALGNFVDARSTYTLGHSIGVADAAERAARRLGRAPGEISAVRQASLLHDLGRCGVPVTIWDKTQALTREDWARIKRHPALTELMLARSSSLGHLGTLAGLHHERLDGSGYRGVPASFIPVAAQVLAASDAYRTRLEPRPHRPAAAPTAAATELQPEAQRGKFDPSVIDAFLAAVDQPASPMKRQWPAGLTDREVEVLLLAARGLSNRQIAQRLVVSAKTVDHHIQHVYTKIGVSTRVGATLFALQNGLLRAPATDAPVPLER
jgi:HD-GYP domain-containing protein (c-di-GMP phosphodiesterase class II)/DNA-binding CsgD family transcriptional regulator